MDVVWQSFEGRYSDNPQVLYEQWIRRRPGDSHVWLAGGTHRAGFPSGVDTIPVYGPECVDALERADVVVANTHTDVEWQKRPETLYLQTWHGTPLKRVHLDVLWAPTGRLQRLSRDVARWDLLLSPNEASTPRLRGAFDYRGEVLESGYPRNDILSSPGRDRVRRKTRAELGIADDVTVILYTPTWRDDVVFADETSEIRLDLHAEQLLDQLGPRHCLLVRAHPLVTDRLAAETRADVIDVSRHSELAELYLAADVMVTDYSSTMFDFAVTGKPMLFFVPDLEHFRDTVRGFYFDLADEAPGPIVLTQDDLVAALANLPAVATDYADTYASFRERYCHLEDGRAAGRVLDRIWQHPAPRTRTRLRRRSAVRS